MKGEDILQKVRYALSDTETLAWSSVRLLDLLYEGLLDIATSTILFDDVAYFSFENNVSTYDVSDKVLRFSRFEYNKRVLPKYTYDEMDTRYTDWETRKGKEPEAIVYNLSKIGAFRVYPILEGLETRILTVTQNMPYGIITDIQPLIRDGTNRVPITQNSVYGTITSLSFTTSRLYPITEYVERFVPFPTEYMKLYYTKMPPKLTNPTEELPSYITDIVVSVVIHYIIGMALRDNLDASDRQRGNEEIQLYGSKKHMLTVNKSTNTTRKLHTTEYRGMG